MTSRLSYVSPAEGPKNKHTYLPVNMTHSLQSLVMSSI